MDRKEKTADAIYGETMPSIPDDMKGQQMPYIMVESFLARQSIRHRIEREKDRKIIKGLIIALIVSIVVSIAAILTIHFSWQAFEEQFDTYSYDQDGAGINNINTGKQGSVFNGATTESEETQESEQG